jgi:hypothetical protein
LRVLSLGQQTIRSDLFSLPPGGLETIAVEEKDPKRRCSLRGKRDISLLVESSEVL